MTHSAHKRFTGVERVIDRFAHRILDKFPDHWFYGSLAEFLVFGLKQAWACLFGGAMLALLLGTYLVYPDNASLARYDFLFLASLSIQLAMIAFRLETISEVRVILIFHVIGTIMEVFKTSMGSWKYPEASFFRVAEVPLFSGFMYASVGSYIARTSRLFDLRYSNYPKFGLTLALCIGIYINFFTHHFIWDFRYVLFAFTALIFWRCWVHFRFFRFQHRMPLLLSFFLIALFIWFAENIATFSGAWIYPKQEQAWKIVSPSKLGAWYLLMIISFVLVTIVHRPKPKEDENQTV